MIIPVSICPFTDLRILDEKKKNDSIDNSKRITYIPITSPPISPKQANSMIKKIPDSISSTFFPWAVGAAAQTAVTYPLKVYLVSTQTKTKFNKLWFKETYKSDLSFVRLAKKEGIIKTIKLGYQGSFATFATRYMGLLLSDHIKQSLSSESELSKFLCITSVQAGIQTKMDYESLKGIKGTKSAIMNKVCNTRFQILPFTITFLRESFFIGALFFNPYEYKENKLGFLLVSMLAGSATTGLDSLKTIYQSINLEQPTFATAVEKSLQSTKSIKLSDFLKMHVSKASGIRSLMIGLGIFSVATGNEVARSFSNQNNKE